MKIASGKKWIMAIAVMLMVCVCAFASAQSYSLGDEDVEIETIQTALKKLKLYSGDITGHYGAKTEAAVKLFQKRNDLEDDGIAGEGTIQALYESAGITYSKSGDDSSSVSYSDAGTLRHGSRSEAVRQMQQDLKDLGYYTGSITGNFGTLTEAAVMKFQRANNLSADGIAGAKTLAKIADKAGSSSGSSASDSSSDSSSSGSSSSTLRYGVKSEAVRQMQQDLKDLGYYTGSVTGNFGNLTKEAVYDFQRANNLSADGVAGAKTLAKIEDKKNSSSGSSSSNSSSGSSSSSSSSSMVLDTSVTLMKNSSGDEVRKLQKMLASLGYYSGNQTGNFGDKTRDAVITFQKRMGLTADGVAGKRTLTAINAQYKKGTTSSSGSSSNSSNDVQYKNFYNWRTNYSNGEYCSVYDPATGYTWTLRIMTKDAHMDAEPATAEDTAIMNKAFGGQVTWTPKPVWVTFADGQTYIGSTHNVPHTPYHLKDNNFDGHLCVHFPISMEKAQEIGPYATSHQETINEAWEKLLAKYR